MLIYDAIHSGLYTTIATILLGRW